METLGIGSSIDHRIGAPPTMAFGGSFVPPPWQQPVVNRDGLARPGLLGESMPLMFTLASQNVRPAGDPLTEGAPQQNYTAGTYDFRGSLLSLWNIPVVDRARFAAALQSAVADIINGGTTDTARTNIVVGGQQTVNLSPGILSTDRNRPGVWTTVTGIISAPNGMSIDQVNRAVARALAQSQTWRAITVVGNAPATRPAAYTPPPDGAQLHALLSNVNVSGGSACTGGYKDAQCWARGCVRVVRSASVVPPPVQQATPTPATPSTPAAPATPGTPAPTRPSTPTAPAPAQSCVVAPRDYFYLRPTATFAATGPRFPAGTPILLVGQTTMTSRGASGATLTLYRVRIQSGSAVGQEGFAALSAADLQPASAGSCPPGTAIAQYAINQSGGGGATTPSAPTPARPTTPSPTPARPTTPSPVLNQIRPAAGTSMGTVIGALAAALAVAAGVGGVVYWKREELGLTEPKRDNVPKRTSVPATRVYSP